MRRLLLVFCLALTAALAQAQVAVPPLSGRVVDLTGALSTAAREDLAARLAVIERDRGSQVAILLLPTVQPEGLEAFGIRVADAWKLGRAGVDDGAILLVALQDRRLRIEVGRGLEGAVPDAVAKRIVADTITPYFQRGDFHGGLAAGVDALAARIGAEALPPPVPPREVAGPALPLPLPWLVVGLFFVLAALGVAVTDGSLYSQGGRRRGGGGFPPGGGWGGGGGGRGGGGGFRGGGGGFGGGGASGGW
ncbi:MAG: TPM domain-containing protein [Candidatus Dactylopiibacterium sp.]|nr:TPM domain-containing protein [Candidatus Dactylopiibacterium sp.]